jgi:hypothetical protein
MSEVFEVSGNNDSKHWKECAQRNTQVNPKRKTYL